jgi:hypothetical protein
MPGAPTSTEIDPSHPELALKAISAAILAHRPVVTNSIAQIPPNLKHRADELGVANWHVYSVKSVDLGKKTISLQNPWGFQDLDNLSAHDYATFYTWFAAGPKP